MALSSKTGCGRYTVCVWSNVPLAKDGDLTVMGKSLWHYATIGHILKNRLYCGELEYRKEYVPDYLEQKWAKNNGELERVIVEGRHQPIVTKEEFERVQKLIEEKRPQMEKCRKNRGVHSDDLWRRKFSTPYSMTRKGRLRMRRRCLGAAPPEWSRRKCCGINPS